MATTSNKQLDDLPELAAPSGGVAYVVKNDTDYKVNVGGANGFAVLDAGSKIPDAQIGRGLASGVAPLNASTKIDGTYIDKGLVNGVAPLDGAGKVDRSYLPIIGGDGLVWATQATPVTAAKGKGYLVTAAVDITLPAVNSAGDPIVIYAKVANVRVVTNGTTITGLTPGDNILMDARSSLWLVASGTNTWEIV